METFEINVNLTERSFSIKGTEEFIDRKIVEFVDLLAKFNNAKNTILAEERNQSDCDSCEKKSFISENGLKKYIDAGLVSVDGDNVLILRKVPGKNNAEKMKKIALITLYTLNKPISSKAIIKNCEKLNCYDSTNFAKIFKRDTSGSFIIKESGKSWTLEATIPGLEKAEEILEDMYNVAKK